MKKYYENGINWIWFYHIENDEIIKGFRIHKDDIKEDMIVQYEYILINKS